MSSFEKERIVKLGGDVQLLRAEYVSSSKGFDARRYEKALENYAKTIAEMGVLPLDDFYRIGIEHLHLLRVEHQQMLIKLKKDSDRLESNALPAAISRVIGIFKQVASGLSEIEQEHPGLLELEAPPVKKKKK